MVMLPFGGVQSKTINAFEQASIAKKPFIGPQPQRLLA